MWNTWIYFSQLLGRHYSSLTMEHAKRLSHEIFWYFNIVADPDLLPEYRPSPSRCVEITSTSASTCDNEVNIIIILSSHQYVHCIFLSMWQFIHGGFVSRKGGRPERCVWTKCFKSRWTYSLSRVDHRFVHPQNWGLVLQLCGQIVCPPHFGAWTLQSVDQKIGWT